MCHSFLIISYWNDTEFLTLPKQLFEPTLAFNNIDELNSFLLDQCHQIIQTATHPEDRSKVIN
ncbi:hypothetical protein AB8P58_20340, partial [Yersinia enterocolitica]